MNNIFYIMAQGPSINDITDEEWEYLKDKDTIGFAAFPFSGKKTKYYFSYERRKLDKIWLSYMALHGHLDTILLLGIGDSIKHASDNGFKNIIPIHKGPALGFQPPLSFKRHGWFLDQPNPPCKFKECRAYSFNQPLFRFRCQLSSVINVALILGAEEIRLCGVDLHRIYNFFELDKDKQLRTEDETKLLNEFLDISHSHRQVRVENTEKGTGAYENIMESELHITALPYKHPNFGGKQLRGMLDVLEWMDKELCKEGYNGIYVTNKKSELYKRNKLEYKPIMDD